MATEDIFSRATPVQLTVESKDKTSEDSKAIQNAMLRNLYQYYTHPDVEEIVINRPGEVWLRRRRPKPGEDIWVALIDETLTFEYLERVCRIIANSNGLTFGGGAGQTPVVYAALPGGHRFTGAMYKNIVYDEITPRGGVAMAIRQAARSDQTIEYSAYGLTSGMRVVQPPKFKQQADTSTDDLGKLRQAINEGSHLIVSGATSTGKTTLLNKILTELDPRLRVMTIEDTRELKVPHPNRVHIVLSRTEQTNDFNDSRAIDLVVRMTPDVILCGEVSKGNAATIWELTGSGHGSMMTTIHAEDPEEALRTFIKRMQESRPNLNEVSLFNEMKERFTVVQIVRDHNGARRITAIETFK